MGKWGRRLAFCGGLVLAIFLACYAALYFLIRSEGARRRAEAELSRRSGYDVRIRGLRLAPWFAIAASGVSVAKDGESLFQARRILCSFLPTDFWFKRIHRLSLDQPRLSLHLKELFKSSGKGLPGFSIGTLNIAGGEFVLDTGEGAPVALRSISLSAAEVGVGGALGLRLQAYVPSLDGRAAVSISGGLGEQQAKILVEQEEEKPAAGRLPHLSEKKGLFEASIQMSRPGNDALRVSAAGSAERLRWRGEQITGQFHTLLAYQPKAEALDFSLALATPAFPVKLLPEGPISLPPAPLQLSLTGRYAGQQKALTLQELRVASRFGVLTGEGSVALGQKPAGLGATLRLRDLALDTLKPLLPKPLNGYALTGRLAADFKLSGSTGDPIVTGLAWNDQARVQGEGISLSQLLLKIPFRWTHSTLQVQGARIQAADLTWGRKGGNEFAVRQASLAGDALKGPREPLRISAAFELLDGRFSAAQGSRVGEHLTAKGNFTCQDCAGDATFSGAGRIESLELLWNKFFGDFKGEKPSIELGGSYRKETGEVSLERCRVALGSMARLDVQGRVRDLAAGPSFDLELRGDDFQQAPLYDFFVRDTFKESYPLLGAIAVGGKSSLGLRAKGSLRSFTVEGELRLEDGEIRERSGRWRVGPMVLDLPLRLSFPEAASGQSSETPPVGKVVIRQVETASGTIPEIAAPIALWNNRLRFPEPIRVSLFGGSAVVSDLAWRDVVSAPADFSFSLGVSGVRLLDLTGAMGWYRFGGVLSGSVPDVHWVQDSLRSSGAVTLNVFGGQVTIRGMEVDEPFSSLRSVKMDVRLEGIDLEQASETFEFGRVSGVLAGTVDHLVLSQGEPAEFRADIESVEKPGVSQWISVEALNKITILSSGNEGGFLYGGLAEFFEFFRYSKLGFKAALKNDKLVLRGIESRDGKDYLVVGTLLPPTVNIVSFTQEVGFSELVERLKRVREHGAAKGSRRP